MQKTNKVGRIFEVFDDILAWFGGISIVFIGGATFYEVTMRKLFRAPSLWVSEIVEYSLLFVTFSSAAWLLRQEGHVTMDIVLNRLQPRTQSAVIAITSVVCSFACLIITIFGFRVVISSYQLGYTTPTELELSQAAILAIIPLGGFLLFIQFLRRAFGAWNDFRRDGRQS